MDAFNRKGWALYEIDPKERLTFECVQRGPALKLKHGASYWIMPLTSEPDNIFWVYGILARLSEKDKLPGLVHDGRDMPIRLVKFEGDNANFCCCPVVTMVPINCLVKVIDDLLQPILTEEDRDIFRDV